MARLKNCRKNFDNSCNFEDKKKSDHYNDVRMLIVRRFFD